MTVSSKGQSWTYIVYSKFLSCKRSDIQTEALQLVLSQKSGLYAMVATYQRVNYQV